MNEYKRQFIVRICSSSTESQEVPWLVWAAAGPGQPVLWFPSKFKGWGWDSGEWLSVRLQARELRAVGPAGGSPAVHRLENHSTRISEQETITQLDQRARMWTPTVFCPSLVLSGLSGACSHLKAISVQLLVQMLTLTDTPWNYVLPIIWETSLP